MGRFSDKGKALPVSNTCLRSSSPLHPSKVPFTQANFLSSANCRGVGLTLILAGCLRALPLALKCWRHRDGPAWSGKGGWGWSDGMGKVGDGAVGGEVTVNGALKVESLLGSVEGIGIGWTRDSSSWVVSRFGRLVFDMAKIDEKVHT